MDERDNRQDAERPDDGYRLSWGHGCLLVCILVFVWALVIPAVIGVNGNRGPKRRSICGNNLKQIMLALHNYHEDFRSFPPVYTTDANGHRLHSWRTLILPFLERRKLYEALRLDEPWDSTHNQTVWKSTGGYPNVFECPNEDRWPSGLGTSYLAVVGAETMWPTGDTRKLSDVTDGAARTIMLVEVLESGIDFFEPRDLEFNELSFRLNDSDHFSPRSKHGAWTRWPWQTGEPTVMVAFADGSAMALPQSTPPETLRALLTISGGETIDLPY